MSSSGWKWDYDSNQYLWWSEPQKAWFNEARQRVSRPNFDPPVATSSRHPNTASQSINSSGRKSSSDVNKGKASSAALGTLFQNLSIGPPNLRGTANAPREHTAVDPSSGAETRWELGQPKQSAGSSARSFDPKRVLQLEGRKNQLVLKGYGISNQPQTDYKRGRVIEVLLVPPQAPGSATSGITPNEAATALPRQTIARLRRFVIIRESVDGRNTFEAVAIKTYNGQGVAAAGVIKSHHAIIFTGEKPDLNDDEQPQRLSNRQTENGVLPQAIRVETYDRGTALDPMARLDYGDRYLFDYGVPNIRPWGRVQDSYQAALFIQYTQVWAAIQRAVQGVAPNPGAVPTAQSTTTEVPASQIDYTSADSGPITDEMMSALLKRYSDHAERNNLSMPTQRLTPSQIHGLAVDSGRRALYLRRIRDSWNDDD